MPQPPPLLALFFAPGPSPSLVQSTYHIETAENIVSIAEDFTTEPSPHDNEGQDYGQQLDAESERMLLLLGDRLIEFQLDADE